MDEAWQDEVRQAAGTKAQTMAAGKHHYRMERYWAEGGEDRFGLVCDVCGAPGVVFHTGG